MTKRDKLCVLVGSLVFILLNYPILQIFNRQVLVGEVPVLPLYMCAVWALAIAALFVFGRRLTSPDHSSQEKPGE
jgi:hypothetical protein